MTIKEIELDHFNNINELKQTVETWIKEDDMYWNRWFSLYDLKTLLDYITNLQQLYENALKINQNENKYRTELEDKYVVLQQEVEKLREYKKNATRKHWQQKCAEHHVQEKIYKSRCEKAIEYLKDVGCYDEETKVFCDDVYEELPYLLNILQGSDGNE